jgi:hypothetical protein
MKPDSRCCGTDACIINEEGYCWCGQKWDGCKMSFQSMENTGRNPGDGTASNTSFDPNVSKASSLP